MLRQQAQVYTRQQVIRETIKSIVWMCWAALLTVYAWPLLEVLFGYRFMDGYLFFEDARAGWLGVIAAYLSLSLGLSGLQIFFGVTVPYVIRQRSEDAKRRRDIGYER